MKRALVVAASLAALAIATSAGAADVVSPLAALSTSGITAPPGTGIRLYSAPVILGSAFFDGTRGSATLLSAERGQRKLVTLDPAGNAVTRTVSDVLAGISARSGMALGPDVLAVFDYWPEGESNYAGLFRVAPDGSFTAWPLTQSHGGSNSLAPAGPASLFLPASLPAGVRLPAGMTARVLRANYTFGPVGRLFAGKDGSICALTSSPNRRTLARIAPDGSSAVVTRSEVLVGNNLRAAAPYGDGYVVAVDYAPQAGNSLGGIYRLAADGTYAEWGLAEGHGGISDLIPAPQGGYYFTDFENDNLWYITTPGQREQAVLSSSPAALWSVAASQAGGICAVNWVPGEWWSNGGVNAVYRIAGDAATLAAEAPEGSRFFDVAAGTGGLFGTAFYVTDDLGGRILRLEADNTLTPVVTGLPNPQRLCFDPATGDLVVVCAGEYLVWLGADLSPFAMPPEDGSFKGLYFSDFENDNVWLVPADGSSEIPILESDVPPGLGTIAYNDVDHTIYALNWQGSGWPFGGEDAVYAVHPSGAAVQVLKGSYAGIAMSQGGPFGRALYLSDAATGRLLRLEGGQTTEVASGLPAPGALAFDPGTGNLLVICDSGRQVAWIGPRLPDAAAGDPGTVGPYFSPAEQASADIAANSIHGRLVTLALPNTRLASTCAVSKVALSGDFDITATIRMSARVLQDGQNRTAAISVTSDVAGQRDSQTAYIGIMQKTAGYAGTAGQYVVYSDMKVGSGWGRFSTRSLTGPPEGLFRIQRRAGVISTYVQEGGDWVQVSTWGDGFADRVRIFLSIDTSWDASLGVAHEATFEGPDFGGAGGTAVLETVSEGALPSSPTLRQNYPNPFNAATQIRYILPREGNVSLEVFDLAGQRVVTLASGPRTAGEHTVTWDGRDQGGRLLATGVYLYRLQAAGREETRRLLLLR